MSKHQFNRNFAVVIGINDYTNGIGELETAVPDAYKLAQILQKQYQALKQQYQAQNRYEVQLILNQRATFNQLNQLISDFKKGQIPLDNEKVAVTEDDRVFFYFAGHGIALEALENQEGPVGYLIPQDATKDVSSTYLPMQELHDALNALPCRHMLAILDCCFAGAFRWASLKREIVPKVTVYKERYDRFISDRAWQVITSAADDQKALDSWGPRRKVIDGNEVHSPFAKALFDALRGGVDEGADSNKDGIITATELYSYLRDQVEILTENRYKRQTPGLCPLKKHDKGEFIFLLPYFERDKLEDAPPLNEENNPYQGLQSYDEKDSYLFFGRENLIQKLYQKAIDNKQALTVVLGASGTGKSSLMKAGLLPRLRDSQEHLFKILDPMRPRESPLNALAQVCLLIAPTMTAAELAKDEQALANIVELWSKNYPNTKLLLPVDQFEELITICKSDQEREQFQKLIKNAIAKYPDNIHVVITLRLDFEAQFQNSVLKDFWNDDTRFVVPLMTQDEFREVIEKPASEKVVYFDPPTLVDDLINEVVQMPGALPLLSFTLSELYLKYLGERRDNRALKKEDYEKLGRVVGSLTQRADQEYDRLVAEDPTYKDTVRCVMLRMISGGELARRQVPKSELIYPDEKETERVNTVIKRFSEARLIVEGSNPQGESYVEPAHDALVMGWGRIRNWLNERQAKVKAVSQWNQIKTWFNGMLVKGDSNRVAHSETEKTLKVNLPLQRELTNAANNWSKKKESDKDKLAVGFLWDRDPRLPQLEQIQQSDDNWFNRTESQFVERSITQKRRNIRNFWIGIGVSFTVVTAFALYFWWQLQQSQLREKAARSENLLSTDPLESLVIAIDAIGQNRNTPIVNRNIQPEVQNSLLNAVQTARERNRFTQSTAVSTIALSRDGKRIASTDSKGIVYLWDLQGNQLGQPLKGNGTSIGSLEFSPDGKILIAGSLSAGSDTLNSVPNPVQFWDLQGNQIQPFGAYSATITTATFSPDGRLIVGGGPDGTIYWRNLQGNPTVQYRKVNSSLQELNSSSVSASSLQRSNSSAIRAVAFSPNGIASVDQDGCVYLWQLQSNQLNEVACNARVSGRTFTSFDIQSIALNKNGDRILINLVPDFSESGLGIESFALLWSLKEGKWKRSSLKVANPGFSSKVLFAAFSPDGNTIVTGDQDGSVRLWDAYGKDEKSGQPLLGHSSNVESVAFSSDGKRVISSSTDGTIRLWDVEQNLSKQPKNFSRYGTSMVLSPDGQTLAIGGKSGKQGTVTLLNITGNQIGQILVGTKIQEESKGDYENGHPLAVSSNGYVVVVDNSDNNKSHLTLWHPGSTTESQPIGSPEIKFGGIAAISPDSQRIVSTVDEGDATGTIRIWDIQGNPIGQPVKNDKNFSVHSIAFSRDSQQVVSGSTNFSLEGASNQSTVCLLHLQVDGLKKKKPCKSIPGELNKVAFSPDGQTVAIGQKDGGLYLWNLQTNIIGQRFGGNEQPVLSIAFSPDSKMLASGSRDGSMRLWNLNGNPIGRAFQSYTNQSAVSSIAFNRDDKNVIVAYTDGNVRFWQANLEHLLQVACDRLRDHSIWKNPGNEDVRGAKKTCETYVWNTQIPQNGEK
jgi:WD40 repeat protein/uncharacterized caspase-like protein